MYKKRENNFGDKNATWCLVTFKSVGGAWTFKKPQILGFFCFVL